MSGGKPMVRAGQGSASWHGSMVGSRAEQECVLVTVLPDEGSSPSGERKRRQWITIAP